MNESSWMVELFYRVFISDTRGLPMYKCSNQSGVTLLEIMVAMGIFAVVVGISAASLTSFYASMETQKERIAAAQSCRGVINLARQMRAEFYHVVPDQNRFPEDWQAWLNGKNQQNWPDFTSSPGYEVRLRDHSIVAQVYDLNGDEISSNTNPVVLHVRASWRDARGRMMDAYIATILSGQ